MLYDQQIITDMGILSDIAYSEYGPGEFIDYGEEINANEDNSFTLSTSYTVLDYIDTPVTNMQAILLRKNDSSGQPTDKYVIAFRGTQETADKLVELKPTASSGGPVEVLPLRCKIK